MFRRRFRFRHSRGGFARRVRAVIGTTLVKRVSFDRTTIPDVTSVNFDNPLFIDLLACREAIDEEIESTGGTTPGTDVADCPVYSRLTSMKLNILLEGATSVSTYIRWLLYKMPDGESLITGLGSSFHSSDDTPTFREARKYTMAKGHLVLNPSTAVQQMRVFVSKGALKRVSPMRENDRIRLVIAKAAEGTTCTVAGFGNLYVRANG